MGAPVRKKFNKKPDDSKLVKFRTKLSKHRVTSKFVRKPKGTQSELEKHKNLYDARAEDIKKEMEDYKKEHKLDQKSTEHLKHLGKMKAYFDKFIEEEREKQDAA